MQPLHERLQRAADKLHDHYSPGELAVRDAEPLLREAAVELARKSPLAEVEAILAKRPLEIPPGYTIERVGNGGHKWICRVRSASCSAWSAIDAIRAAQRDAAEHPEQPAVQPSGGLIYEDLLELADDIELNLGNTVEPEAARQNIDLFRRAAAIVRVHETGERTATVYDPLTNGFVEKTVHGCAPVTRERMGKDGHSIYVHKHDFEELTDHLRPGPLRHAQAVAEVLWHTLRRVGELDPLNFGSGAEFEQEVLRLAARRTSLIADLPRDERISDGAWLGAHAPELVDSRFVDIAYMADPNRTVFRFEGLPDVALLDADAQKMTRHYLAKSFTGVTQPPDPDRGQVASDIEVNPDSPLAARLEAAAENVVTMMEFSGGKAGLPELIREALTHSVATMAEAAEELRRRELFWLIDEFDAQDQRRGFAVPSTPRIDAAMLRWATSFEAIAALEEKRAPLADPLQTPEGNGLRWRRDLTRDDLDEIVVEDGESVRVRFLSEYGVRRLVQAIDRLTEGESLYLAGGVLATCYHDEDERESTDLVNLRELAMDPQFGEEWVGEEAAAHDVEAERQRHEENLRDHEEFASSTDPPNQPQTLAAIYAQHGWTLHLTAQRVHLLDEMGVILCDPGALIKGVRIEPEQLGDEIGRELCGLCCATANDRMAQG